jgi:hypothetical protein
MSHQSIVINRCFGGFGLSYAAVMHYAKLKGIKLYASQLRRKPDGSLVGLDYYVPWDGQGDPPFVVLYSRSPLTKTGRIRAKSHWSVSDLSRDDPALITTVRALRQRANGECAELKVVRVPGDVKWTISEYDGMETVDEVHRSWS